MAMSSKDYYATLMVHPSAAAFVIDAAYKRLAREYHPDVCKSSDAHRKMVELNEAYEVLSNPALRKTYDQEYARNSQVSRTSGSSTSASRTEARNTASTSEKSPNTAPKASPPSPPDPISFGVSRDYFERAVKGSRLWKKREHRIPNKVKWLLRVAFLAGAALISAAATWPHLEVLTLFLSPAIVLLVAEVPVRIIEGVHDSRLKRDIFNPRYNPNPSGYKQYAAKYAEYQAQVATVYVSKNWIYHSRQFCSRMYTSWAMPKWEAVATHAQPCSHCSHFSIFPRRLPPPFGDGYIPSDKA
jgi:curved DNA-binding protein CbpA